MESVKETAQHLDKQRNSPRIQVYILLGIFAAALILIIMRQLPMAIIAFLAGICLYFIRIRPESQAYSDAVAAANLRYGLTGLQDMTYQGKDAALSNEIPALQMFPMRKSGSVMAVQAITAQGNGYCLRACEMAQNYEVPSSARKDIRFLTGTLFRAQQAHRTYPSILLLRTELLHPSVRDAFLGEHGYAPAACRGDLSENWLCRAQGDSTVPDAFWDAFAALGKKADRLAAVRLQGDTAAIYLDRRFYTGKTSLSVLPTPEQLSTCPLAEWPDIASFLEALPRIFAAPDTAA